MRNFPLDPKDIHDGLEEQGLDTSCYLMSEHGNRASYRLILRGLPEDADFLALVAVIKGAVCEPASVNLRRLHSGQVIGTLTVCAPKAEPA